MAVHVHRIHLIELAFVFALTANRLDRFRHARVFADLHDVGGHQPAGRILRVREQLVHTRAIGDLGQHRLSFACGQLGDEIGRIVRRQLLDQLGRVFRSDGQQQLFGVLDRLHFGERARRDFDGQLGDHASPNVLFERREDVGEIRRVNVMGALDEGRQVVVFRQLLQLVEPKIGTAYAFFDGVRHEVGPPSAMVRTGPRRTATRSTRVALAARTSNSSPWCVNRSPARGMRPSAWISKPPTVCAPAPRLTPSISVSAVTGVFPSISTIRVVVAAGAAAAGAGGAGNGSNSSPTRSLRRSSKVTRPAVPPNSSSTTAKCCPPRCISSIKSAARVVAGTVNGGRTWTGASGASASRSSVCATPTTSSNEPR